MGANKLSLDLSRRARLSAFLVALILSQKEALALEDFLMAVPSKTICSAYLFIGKDQGFFFGAGAAAGAGGSAGRCRARR